MRLPIRYFDAKLTGDIMQRITDNYRIEQYLTGSSLSTLFSLLNFGIFSIVLAFYSLQIFGVFLLGTALYFLWIIIFMKRRAALDYKRFRQSKKTEKIKEEKQEKKGKIFAQEIWCYEVFFALFFLPFSGKTPSFLSNVTHKLC
jgi:ATP-binding cassette subfamily B protein